MGRLSAEEERRVEIVAKRLRAEARSLVAELPSPVRSIKDLVTALRVDRGTAQRFQALLNEHGRDLELPARCPGIRALESIVASARERSFNNRVVEGFEAATRQFADLIGDLAGSQSKLGQRIRATLNHADRESRKQQEQQFDFQDRANLFDAASGLMKRSAEVFVGIHVSRPNPDDPTRMDDSDVRGFVGHVARPGGMPLSFMSCYMPVFDIEGCVGERCCEARKVGQELKSRPVDYEPDSIILKDFSSVDTPVVVSKGDGVRPHFIIDPEATQSGRSIDMFMGQRVERILPMPDLNAPRIHFVSMSIRYPCRALLFDMYIHRTMAQQCIPYSHLYHCNLVDLVTRYEDAWHLQFPTDPPLQILGPGIENSACSLYDRQAELTEYWFEKLGWPADEFVGFRIMQDYPIWGGSYCMIFDYESTK